MSLPKFQTPDQSFTLLQTNWAAQIDPVLANPITSSVVLQNVALVTGQTVINHTLGKNLTGWNVIRQRGNAIIWDNQDNNPLPGKTLWLISSSGITVDLLCF